MTSLPTLESVLHIDLGQAGASTTMLDEGWSAPQAGARTMHGRRSRVSLDLPDRDGAFFLQVKLDAPTAAAGALAGPQPLRLILNGYEVASHSVCGRVTLTDYVPAEALDSEAKLRLVLDHPAATGDDAAALRVRAIRLLRVIDRSPPRTSPREALEVPPLREMLLDFENLGEGPAFALLRQRQGLRPLDVIQAGHAQLADWLALLDSDFAAVASPAAVRAVATTPAEGAPTWSITCAGHDFSYDTGVPISARDQQAVAARERARLEIAVRWLRQTLSAGNKMLLFHQATPASDEQIIPLLAAVQDRGPNTILWVTPAETGHAAGTVEVLMQGLLRGYVAPGTSDAVDAGWLQMCRLAWRSWRAMTGLAPFGAASDAAAA